MRCWPPPACRRTSNEEHDNRYFEACLPIEEIARRGRDTLRFGPMKPMGLTDPRTGRRPYAVVQLAPGKRPRRQLQPGGVPESHALRRQQRVLRMIPGLEHAEFLRYGQVHRNTYINGPALLNAGAATATASRRFFSPDRFPASKGTWNPSRPVWSPGEPRRRSRTGRIAAPVPARDRAGIAVRLRLRRRSGAIISPPISLSICCRSSRESAARPQAAPRGSMPAGA